MKIKNGGAVTFVVCENLTSSSGIYGKCNMSTGVTSLRPGATTGWTDADGVWCG